jgi:hypothetical protein
MSVDNPDEIDFIGQSRETGTVRMVISDHLPWDNVEGHLEILRRKIDRYTRFIQSGDINAMVPTAKNNLKSIEVFFMMRPPKGRAINFLEDTGSQLAKVGIDFQYQRFTEYQ